MKVFVNSPDIYTWKISNVNSMSGCNQGKNPLPLRKKKKQKEKKKQASKEEHVITLVFLILEFRNYKGIRKDDMYNVKRYIFSVYVDPNFSNFCFNREEYNFK